MEADLLGGQFTLNGQFNFMKKGVFCIIFFFSLSNAICQQIRTFNTLNLSPTFSKKLNTFNLSFGEMIQVKKSVPFRFLASLNYSGNFIKKANGIQILNLDQSL